MATKNTYILAPDLTTAPPPDGPVGLGHILEEPSNLDPLNTRPGQFLKISPDEIFGPHKMDGFTATRRDLTSKKFGIFARFLAHLLGVGVGVNAGATTESDDDIVYSFMYLETTYFNPTDDYIHSAMSLPDIRTYMQASKFSLPVYMITGFKIGRGVSVRSSHEKGHGINATVEAGQHGLPATAGIEIHSKSARSNGFSFERGDDCIVALRLRKIRYKSGEIKHKVEVKGATMQDGSKTQKENEIPELDMGDGEACEVAIDDVGDQMMVIDGMSLDGEVDSRWIIPASLQEP